MSERPILFRGEMVRAILDGRKSQTRRVVRFAKGVPYERYGVPGDHLWVREVARIRSVGPEPGELSLIYRADEHLGGSGEIKDHVVVNGEAQPYHPTVWTPSIHMPRWASRILLEVTGVRVERVQEISDADAIAEGIVDSRTDQQRRTLYADQPLSEQCPHLAFRALWDRTNAKRGFGWDVNPWTWVLSFRRV